MACGAWDIEGIITHELALDNLEKAIRSAGDVRYAGNVVVRMPNEG